MMKVKVKKQFRDKHTEELHKVGDVFPCTEARYKEILAKGEFVEKITEQKTKKTAEAEETA